MPPTFYNAFYQHLGRKRDYPLTGFLSALILQIDSSLARMLTFDTSGIKLYVAENNPKILNALIRKLKTYYKDNPVLILTRWLIVSCPHRLLLALMQNICILTGTSANNSE